MAGSRTTSWPTRCARGGLLLAAAALLASPTMLSGTVSPEGIHGMGPWGAGRGLVGAWIKGSVFDHAGADDLAALAERTGLEVVPFGAPLWRSDHLDRTRDLLGAIGDTPAILQVDTFKLPGLACCAPLDEAGRERIRATFAAYAHVARDAGNVVLAVGANEPAHKTAWASNAAMVDRVAFEHAAWEATGSDVPFCHKLDRLERFQDGRVTDTGARVGDAATLRAVWDHAQGAVCYDWYRASGDSEATLRTLRAEADARGMAVHVLESSVWDAGSPRGLLGLAGLVHTGRGDTFTVFPLVVTCGVEGCDASRVREATHGSAWQDLRRQLGMAAWWHRPDAPPGGAWELRPAGEVLRSALGGAPDGVASAAS